MKKELLDSTIRFSLGDLNVEEEVDYAIGVRGRAASGTSPLPDEIKWLFKEWLFSFFVGKQKNDSLL